MILCSRRAAFISVGVRGEVEDELVEAGGASKRSVARRASLRSASTSAVEGEAALWRGCVRRVRAGLLAVDGEEDGDHHGDEGLVGADVAGGLFAADVLLAGGEGEDVAALAVHVLGFADEAAGHLAEELFLAGDDAAVGAAVAEGDAEALRFQRDDVGLGGRADDAERDGLGDGDDEERALCVGDVRRWPPRLRSCRRSWATG